MNHINRRSAVKAASAALLTRAAMGANDRIRIAFIGTGGMGTGNLKYAMQQPNIEVAAVCDVYKPRLEAALAEAKNGKQQPKAVHDFREILADKSVDAVCISTPDHWHAYMTVAACKAGKDVWVEKPISTTVEEGQKMVEAARKYDRVVQAGLMQRSGDVFQKAAELVRSGKIGKVTACRASTHGNGGVEGMGAPADCEPPADLDWDLWLGPAPKRQFNPNRFFRGNFRRFWDYAGGTMTDWGVHWLDIIQMAFDEAMPKSIAAVGGKFCVTDNRETPDTILASYQYPGFVTLFENRDCNNGPGGIEFFGNKGTLHVDRSVCRITPEKDSGVEVFELKRRNNANLDHWANFLECMRTRKRPICDIEIGFRSTATALLGNASMRSELRLDWDGKTVAQTEARKYLSREYRAPWKLTV